MIRYGVRFVTATLITLVTLRGSYFWIFSGPLVISLGSNSSRTRAKLNNTLFDISAECTWYEPTKSTPELVLSGESPTSMAEGTVSLRAPLTDAEH